MEKLPDYEVCKEAVELGEATALEKFIYENEPADREQEFEFRHDLLEVLNENK